MRYAKIRKMDVSNGLGVGVSLFVQGCHFHCPNCFNKETWNFNGGKDFTIEVQNELLKLIQKKEIERFSILGGEPLEDRNLFALSCLIAKIKTVKPEIRIWIYSGYTFEDLMKRIRQDSTKYLEFILNNADVLVDGQFIEAEKDITIPFAGSWNQRVIDLNRSMYQNKIILL